MEGGEEAGDGDDEEEDGDDEGTEVGKEMQHEDDFFQVILHFFLVLFLG